MKIVLKTITTILLLTNYIVKAGNEQVIPVDGEQLYNILLTAQKQNSDAEDMLINALSRIHIKDVFRITMVNSKGQRGASVQPDIEINNNKVKLTIGALLEFDLEKYKNGIMNPLRDVLKQVSMNGGEKYIGQIGQNKGVVKDFVWEYGNITFIKVFGNSLRLQEARDDYEILLNVLPNPSNIFKSTYEAYKVKLTENLVKVLLEKIAEGNLFSVHFVFKDEMGEVVFHEKYQGMNYGTFSYSVSENDIRQNIEGARFEAEYAMFIPYGIGKGLVYRKFLPLLISPEILGPDRTNSGKDKQMVVCKIEADSSEIRKIKSYEVYIEEAKLQKSN